MSDFLAQNWGSLLVGLVAIIVLIVVAVRVVLDKKHREAAIKRGRVEIFPGEGRIATLANSGAISLKDTETDLDLVEFQRDGLIRVSDKRDRYVMRDEGWLRKARRRYPFGTSPTIIKRDWYDRDTLLCYASDQTVLLPGMTTWEKLGELEKRAREKHHDGYLIVHGVNYDPHLIDARTGAVAHRAFKEKKVKKLMLERGEESSDE